MNHVGISRFTRNDIFFGTMQTTYIHGERVARDGAIRVGSCAFIRNASGEILLTRRTDNGLWCMPGGGMDAHESIEECCMREVREECNLDVRVERLIGVYTTPDILVIYPDGNKAHVVAFLFECVIVGGELRIDHESHEARYVAPADIDSLTLIHNHKQRIADALKNQTAAFIR